MLALALMLAAGSAAAQEEDLRVNLETALVSRTLQRGVEWTGGGAQGAVEVAQAGWRGRIELQQAFRHSEPGAIGVLGGYAWPLAREAQAPLTFELAARQGWLTRRPAGAIRRTFEVECTLRGEWAGGLRPALTYAREFHRRAETWQIALGGEVPLTRLGAYLEMEAYTGWSTAADLQPDSADGGRRRDAYGYGGLRLGLPYRFGAHSILMLGAELGATTGQHSAWSPLGSGSGVRAAATLGLNFDF